jgi:hypothetical protein
MTGTFDADVNEVGGLNRATSNSRDCTGAGKLENVNAIKKTSCFMRVFQIFVHVPERFISSILDTAQNQMFPLFDWSDGITPR